MDERPVVVSLKWGKGYPVLHTNTLYRALRHYMSRPFRFVCLTDDPEGLADGIETVPLPEFALPREHWSRGMWPKLAAFAPDLFAPGTPVLMMDVDMLVLRDPTALFERVEREGGLHIIADWPDTLERWSPSLFGKERLSNSSLVGFRAGEQAHLWERFRGAGIDRLAPDRNDQVFIHRHADGRRAWPDGWVVSFKKSLAWHFPANLVRPVPRPEEAYMVAFHGTPNPEDMAGRPFRRWGSAEKFGYFPVPWIKRYWEEFAEAA